MTWKGRVGLVLFMSAVTIVAGFGTLGAGPYTARADATTTACTPDAALDALDPCRYDYKSAVVSHIQVPVPATLVDAVNSQPAPSVDNIWVDYIRPSLPAGVTVPTIMDSSPYYNTLGRGYDSILKTPYNPSAAQPPSAMCGGCLRAPFPEWEAHYFVPRGYAVALMDLRGTRNSSGCEVYGDKQEALDAVAVIDWIADQPWSNGKVGMIGGSYDGTMANGAAALYPLQGKHDPGTLAAVVPIRAIDRWYDYQFLNGVESNGQELDPELFTAVLPADDWPNSSGAGGDPTYAADLAQRLACPGIEQIPTDAGYTSAYQDTRDASTTNFWNSRDFLQYTPSWKAATLFIHGLFDNNVKTMNSGQLWQALQSRANPPPTRYLWFNGGHADPDTPSVQVEQKNGLTAEYLMPFTFMQKFEHEVHQWFLQYLKGVDAGVSRDPKVEIQRDYDDQNDGLHEGHWDTYDQFPVPGADSILHFNAAAGTATAAVAPPGSAQWDDEPTGTVAAAQQSFVTDPYPTTTHVSGQFEFDVNIAAQGADTTIAVEVDDVPPGALHDATFATEDVATNTTPFAFTFGYIRPYYRDSINPRGASYPTGGSFLTPGTAYAMSFPSTYTDYVVRRGHRLRFTFSDASPSSLPTYQGNVITMFTGLTDGTSQVRVPVAGLSTLTQTPPIAPAVTGQMPNTSGGRPPVLGLLLGGIVAALAAIGAATMRSPQ